MGSNGRIRVLAVASAGGHWIQLARLSEAFADFDTCYATTVEGQIAPSGNRPVARIVDGSRNSPLRLAVAAIQILRLIRSFRPQAVVTTGAAPGYLALRIGKAFGCRTLWLDSIANVDEISMSGRLARPYADVWLTQWDDLSRTERGLDCWGRVL
jgi:UDP-N-acetylglucosamine:LPS N-acetylglucosamine transferase